MAANPKLRRLCDAPPGLGSRPDSLVSVSCGNVAHNPAGRRKVNPNRNGVWVRLPGRVDSKRTKGARGGV